MNFKNFIEVIVKVKNKRFNSVLILKKELEENYVEWMNGYQFNYFLFGYGISYFQKRILFESKNNLLVFLGVLNVVRVGILDNVCVEFGVGFIWEKVVFLKEVVCSVIE